MVASIKVGSRKLEGARTQRAGSGARRATGHGARGRTGRGRSQGGAGRRCGAPARLTPAASRQPAALAQPGQVLAVSRQPRAVCKHTCTSPKDVSAIPPPARRPWRRSAPGPSPRSRRKDKRAMGPTQPAAISTSHHPDRGNPRGQVEDQSSSEDWVGAGWQAGQECKGQGGGVPVLGPAGESWGMTRWQWAGGIRYSEESPGGYWMAVLCARVSAPRVSRMRRSSAADTWWQRWTKPEQAPRRTQPLGRSRQPPASGPSFSKCRNFSQALNPVPHGHGGSLPADVATPPGSWCCTWLGGRSPKQPVSFQPLPLSWLLSAPPSGREGAERESGERQRGLGGSAGSRAPGKCLNNRTDAAALVSLGCGKVGCCCNWSCSLGLPGAERSQTKTRPAPLEPASGPRTLPFLFSTPAVPRKLGSSRLRPGATALPSLAAAAAAAFFNHRLRQPPPPPPPPAASAVRALPK